jgi:MFS family permease
MPKLGGGEVLRYGFLAAPVAFAGFPIYILAPDFYVTHHGVSLWLLGVVLFFLRLLDGLQDPFIGLLSDKFSSSVLRIIIICSILLVISIYALFHPAGFSPVLWFAIAMGLSVTLYSIICINLNTLGALWSDDKNEQTKIAGARESSGLAGLLLAVTLPQILGKYLPQSQVFLCFSLLLGLLMFMAIITFKTWFIKNRHLLERHKDNAYSLRKTLRKLPDDTYKLFLVYGFSVLASGMPAILVIFFVRDLLKAEVYTGLFLLIYFLSGAITMPLWKIVSTNYGKYRAWLFSMLLAVASFFYVSFLGAGDVLQYALICAISGMALGADLTLPPSILADHIHQNKSDSSAATQFSVLMLLSKAGLAVGSAIALPMLDLMGFMPNLVNAPKALLGLSVAYGIIPCMLKLTGAYFLYYLLIKPKGLQHEKTFENNPHRSHTNA